MDSQPEFWHVRLPNGSVCTLTLDELDDAFQAGQIDESVFVLQHGATAWTTLGALLGIEAAPPVAATLACTRSPRAVPWSIPTRRVRLRRRLGYAIDLRAVARLCRLRAAFEAVGLGARPRRRHGLSEVSVSARPARSKALVAFAVGVAALALVGVRRRPNPNRAAATCGRRPRSLLATSTAAASQPVAAAAPPPAEAPVPAPAPPAAQPESRRLRLCKARKAHRATRIAFRRRGSARCWTPTRPARRSGPGEVPSSISQRRSAAPARRSSAYKSDGKTVFHKGGNKYDPLNSSL
jgi:hypothetical protein